ncbi:MAG: hypothetical protein AAB901_00305 [Patescibacteria group bacterium]
MTSRDYEKLGFAPDFTPDLTPKEMLALGIFGGAYFDGASTAEYPADWFTSAVISDHGKDPKLNYFGIDASQSLEEWIRKGWIGESDPLGWFEWYCRYYLGRRIPVEDMRQIKRHRQMVRHVAQIKYGCRPGDVTCRPKQRQALLHWAYDSRRM